MQNTVVVVSNRDIHVSDCDVGQGSNVKLTAERGYLSKLILKFNTGGCQLLFDQSILKINGSVNT